MAFATPVTAKQIFGEVIERSPAERASFLETACGSNTALRGEVEALLGAFDAADEFLVGSHTRDVDAQATVEQSANLRPTEGPGTVIGRYKLLQEIGHGGFGTVFMAEQREPVVRKVAVKVIKLRMDTRQTLARFAAERQALALMDHPNIARVLDAGATDAGRPYFVMELVRGDPITRFCDEGRLTVLERLELFVNTCHAVQHAHTKGVIHRDLKPSNVLVTIVDDRPIPKVIDFGIAKAVTGRLTEQTLFTEFRQMIGTPAYMSPEQAEMSGVDVDTRSDVYSLGVLLYELLTGTTPFDEQSLWSAGYDELRRIIREVEPPRPSARLSSLNAPPPLAVRAAQPSSAIDIARCRRTDPPSLSRMLRSDLDWIVMKCLEKDRARRYETANGLAMDIGRYLAAEPVVAAPPSAMYRARRFVRRNKGLVVALAGVIATLLIAVGGTTYGLLAANKAERNAGKQAEEARHQAQIAASVNDFINEDFFGSLKDLASDPSMNFAGMRSVLEKASKQLDDASDPGGRFETEPLIQLRLRTTIAEALLNIGAFDHSAVQFDRALGLAKHEYGEDGDETIRLGLRRAWMLLRAGKPDDARPLVHDLVARTARLHGDHDPRSLIALADLSWTHEADGNVAAQRLVRGRILEGWSVLHARRRAELGSQHPSTLDALEQRAQALSYLGRFVEVEPLERELIEGRRKSLAPDDPAVIRAAELLRWTLNNLFRIEEALDLAEQVLEANRRRYGSEHPITLDALRATAWQLKQLGRFLEAERRFKEALKLYKQVLGDSHPDYLVCLANLQNVYLFSERLSEAEELQRDVLATHKRIYGDPHPRTLDATHGLAAVFQRQGRYGESEKLHLEVLDARRRLLGDDDPVTLHTMNDLGWLRQQQGRFAEAAELHLRTLEARRRVLGEDDYETVRSMHNLAIQYTSMERFGDAEPMFRKVLDYRIARVGDAHPDTMDTRQILGATVMRSGRVEEGIDILERALKIAEGAKRDETRYGVLTMHHLAEAYQRCQRYDDAEAMYKRALGAAPRAVGAEHPEMLYPMIGLGWLYNEQGRFADAAEILIRNLEIRRRVLVEGHLDTLRTMETLAVSLRGLGKYAELRALETELIATRQLRAATEYATADDMNEYAWLLLTVEPVDLRDSTIALQWAQRAADRAGHEGASGFPLANILDTLALAQYRTGDTYAAVETEQRAIAELPENVEEAKRAEFEQRLAEFRASLNPSPPLNPPSSSTGPDHSPN